MTSPEFSYRPLLEELTGFVKTEGLDPYEAYRWLYERRLNLGLGAEAYCSSSITSGGHARDESLEMKETIARNTESARILAEQLAADGQLKPESAIEPVFVGKTHWNQAQYMEFWLSVIGGYDFTPGFIARDVDDLRKSAERSFLEAGLDVDLMVGKEPAEARAQEYFKMANAFAGLIASGAEATPVDKVIRMIDTDMSLGAQAERVFARQIGAKVMNICIVKPAEVSDLYRVNRVLAADTARLIKFGATVFDTRDNRVQLILKEDAA